MKKPAVLFLLAGVLGCACAFAQSVAGLGAISGTVRDASGAAVPGARVVVSNESKGIKRTLETTDAGVFTAPSLVPAPGYSVTVDKQGFTQYEVKDIQVLVGQNLGLEIALAVAGASTQVQVEAVAPIVDNTKTDVSQVIGSQQILELPINGRRVDSFVLLSPAVVPDGTFGLVSFRGIAGGNAFLTDGNDTTEQYYNENAGRTRIQSQISQDAVQEFQVVSNNYSAEFGHAMGGVVNTVTRSGGNDFHGTGYWFFRNQDFNARDTFATLVPQEKRNQVGVSAGGKILKNKLFYFANYEALRRNFPLIANITTPGSPLFSTSGVFIGQCGPSGNPAGTATAAQCDAARHFLDRQFQTVPRTVTQDLGFSKIDWRPTERNSFSASLNLLRWVSPNGLQTAGVLNSGAGVGGNANSSVRAKYGRFTWTAIPTSNIVNEFRFGWFKDKQFDYPNDALGIPGIGFLGISITGQSNLGTVQDYPRTNPSENRYQFADSLNWTKGKHSLKFGFDIMRTEDYTNLLFNRTGTYLFPSFDALARDLTGNTTAAKDWLTFTQTIGNPVVDIFMTDYSFFAQDEYKVTPRLTLNLGVRYDYTSLPQPTVTNPDYPATGRIPTYSGDIAPRIGFAYALDNQSKTVVRAGYGIFYGRYPGGLINTFFLGNGVYQKAITFNAPADLAAGPVFPNVLPGTANFNPPTGTVSLNIAAKDFRAPYTQQGDIAIQRQLTANLALTVSYIWSRGLHLTSVNDINIGAPGPVITYRINDTTGNQVSSYSTPLYVRQNRVDTRYARINIIDSGLNSYYNGLAVQLEKRMSHGLTGSFAYTWSHAIDDGQAGGGTPNVFASGGPQSYIPGDYKDEKGSSVLDLRHRVGISAVWAPTLLHSNNAAAKYVVNGWQLALLGTFSSSPAVTPFVQISSAPAPTGFAAANSSTMNGYTSSGLGGRVPFQPIGSLNVAKVERIDVRLTKNFPIKERYRAMFTFDAFNLFNHRYFTSVQGREYIETTVAGQGILNPAAGYAAGTATGGFPDGTNARRLQLGLRFIW
jgi:outer membrane receptor protein involved in Fe transport